MVSFTRGVRETRVADRLDFEIDVELETGLITGHAGVPRWRVRLGLHNTVA